MQSRARIILSYIALRVKESKRGLPPDALERNLKAVENYYVAQLRLWKELLAGAEEREQQ